MAANLDGTYAGLKAAVGSFIHRNDYGDYVDDLIKLGEDRIYNEVRAWDMITSFSTVTATAGYFTAFPSNTIEVKNFWVNDASGYKHVLKSSSMSGLCENYPGYETGTPQEIAFKKAPDGGIQAVLGPPGTKGDTVGGEVYARPTPTICTTTGTTANAFFQGNQGLFLWAALSEAEAYIGADPRIPVWESKFERAKAGITGNDQAKEIFGPLQIRVQ